MEEHHRSFLDPLLESGPLQILVAVLVAMLGLYHAALSIRILIRRRSPITAAFHGLLLFSGPCMVLLVLLAWLPIITPGLFVHGMGADGMLKQGLETASVLSFICIASFIPNLLLAVFALTRSERSA